MSTSRLFQFVAVATLLVLPAFAPQALADVVEVPWSELPARVEGKLVPLDQLPVADCPDDIGDREPSRMVMQVIENTFYKWYEYDLEGEGDTAIYCIVMEKPLSINMTKEEAQVLLSASRLWEEAALKADEDQVLQLDPSDPTLNYPPARGYPADPGAEVSIPDGGVSESLVGDVAPAPPAEGAVSEASPEIVQGTDDRVRITPPTVENYPWNTIAYVTFSMPTGNYRGTAFVVAPYGLMTAGHCVWDRGGATGWANTGTYVVAPAQYQLSEGGTVYRPLGDRTGVYQLATLTAYQGSGGFENDMGAIRLRGAFDLGTYMPIVYDIIPGIANIAGYPPAVQGEANSQGQWYHGDTVNGVGGADNRLLRYETDTSGGNSGGPVWRLSSGIRNVAAVHNYGSGAENGGARFVNGFSVPALVEWAMTFRPSDDPYEQNDTIGTAYNLGSNERTWISHLDGKGIAADDDYYAITVTPGFERILIDLRFIDASGDVDVRLKNAAGATLAISQTTSNDEYIDYIVPKGVSTYYIHVYPFLTPPDPPNDYNLWWDDIQPDNIAAPTNVAASNGTDPDKVIVTWTAPPNGIYYKIWRSTSSGGPYAAISGWVTGTSYDDTSAATYKFYYYKVQAARDNTGWLAGDQSTANLGWRMYPTFTVITPTAANTWQQAERVGVRWSCVNNPNNDQVYLSLRGPEWRGWKPAPCTDGTNTALAYVPINLIPGTYRVRVSWMTNFSRWAESEPFTINAHPVMTPTVPAGGETWQQGTNVTVNWNTTNNATNDPMYLSLRGPEWRGWKPVPCTNGPNAVAGWIPVNLIPGSYRMRISWMKNYGIWYESNPFNVIAKPSITITNPTGGNLQRGQPMLVQWNCSNNPDNDPMYISIKGPDWIGLGSAASPNGANSSTKNLPAGMPTGVYRVRLSWTQNYSVFWESPPVNVVP